MNGSMVRPILNRNKKGVPKNKVLVTAGGGGQPSAEIFFNLIGKAIDKVAPDYDVDFTVLLGAYNTNDVGPFPKTKIKRWTHDMPAEYREARFVISEAGFFTVHELLEHNKPAILIPGARNIDNQELRAVTWELEGCGYCVLPDSQADTLEDKMRHMLNGKAAEFSGRCKSLFDRAGKFPSVIDKILAKIS
ncbi:MAG: glycosyltransferase [Pirellulales bacterium]